MSFTLQLWQKPEDWPWPASYKEADRQVERLFAQKPGGQNPRFIEFGRGLYERFPEETGVWLDGSEAGETDEAVLVFGITTGHDDFAEAYLWAVAVAGRLGLILTDPQTGDTFLPDGRCVDDSGKVTRTPRPSASASRSQSSPAAAASARAPLQDLSWEALRAAVVDRHPAAIYELGHRLRYGVGGQRRHLWVSYALLRLGAFDDATRSVADERWDHVGEEGLPRLRELHDRLAKARGGADLLAIVDAERKALDGQFALSQRELLDSRTWEQGVSRVIEAATAGHEEAVYQAALYSLTSVASPNWAHFDGWSRGAAEWDHASAQQLRYHALARGLGQPDDKPDPTRAAWWRGQICGPLRDWPDEGNRFAQVVAWYAREGNAVALFTRGTQLENGRDGLKIDGLHALDCYAKAAELGHADGTFNTAVLLEGVKAPRPLTTALYLLAQGRGSQLRAEGLKLSADREKVRALMRELARPGHLRAVIEAHVPLAGALALPPDEAPSPAAPRSPTTSTRRRREESDVRHTTGHVGGGGEGASRWWLVLGLVAAPLAMAMGKPGLGLRMALFVAGALGAIGVWRFTARGDWAMPVRLALSAAAAFPVGNLLVCGLLLGRSFTSH